MRAMLRLIFTSITHILMAFTFITTYTSEYWMITVWNFFLSVFFFGLAYSLMFTDNSVKKFQNMEFWLLMVSISSIIALYVRVHAPEIVRRYGHSSISHSDECMVHIGLFMNFFHYRMFRIFIFFDDPDVDLDRGQERENDIELRQRN